MTAEGDQLRFYEDGQSVASARCESMAISTNETIWFGTDAGGIEMWNGRIDEVALFDRALSLVDIYATIAALIDTPVGSDVAVAEDSFNALPAMLGASQPEPARTSMILHSPNGNFAIRRGPWKYVEGKASPTLKKVSRRDELQAQLYNIDADPGEQHNALHEHPEVAKQLADLLETQRSKAKTSQAGT